MVCYRKVHWDIDAAAKACSRGKFILGKRCQWQPSANHTVMCMNKTN